MSWVKAGAVSVAVGAVAVGVAACVADAADEPDMLAVCTNPVSQERVVDELCGDFEDTGSGTYSHNGVGYSYMFFDTRAYPGTVPAVGQKLPPSNTTGFVRSYSPGTKVGKGIPVQGGASVKAPEVKSPVVRGGFGVKGAGSGGSAGS